MERDRSRLAGPGQALEPEIGWSWGVGAAPLCRPQDPDRGLR